jgi:hypothetical protein
MRVSTEHIEFDVGYYYYYYYHHHHNHYYYYYYYYCYLQLSCHSVAAVLTLAPLGLTPLTSI